MRPQGAIMAGEILSFAPGSTRQPVTRWGNSQLIRRSLVATINSRVFRPDLPRILTPCSPPSRRGLGETVQVVLAQQRPSLTAVARGVRGEAGRDEETVLRSN